MLILAVVFAGILGNGHPEAPKIAEAILTTVQRAAEIDEITLPQDNMVALVKHTAASKKVAASLGVDGIIVGELVGNRNALTLRLAVYTGTGVRRSFNEVPLKNRALGTDEMQMIQQNLADDIESLGGAKAKPAPAPVAKVAPKRAAPVVEEEASGEPLPALGDDDEDPLAKKKKAAAAPKKVAVAADDEETTPSVSVEAPAAASKRTWRVFRMNVGAGVVARKYTPGSLMEREYSSQPVGALAITAQIRPWRRIALDGLYDRSIVMNTPVGVGTAPTSIARWEAAADVLATTGKVVVAARAGVGNRTFAIDTDSTARSPDRTYTYAIAGGILSAALGRSVSFHLSAAFEPVVAGDGGWGLDAGAALELALTSHLHGRIGGDVQRFVSSEYIDLLPSAMASVGAVY
jgi:hypothetical protein